LFADEWIDWAVLERLSDAKLKELGLRMGERERILQRFATSQTPTPSSSFPTSQNVRFMSLHSILEEKVIYL